MNLWPTPPPAAFPRPLGSKRSAMESSPSPSRSSCSISGFPAGPDRPRATPAAGTAPALAGLPRLPHQLLYYRHHVGESSQHLRLIRRTDRYFLLLSVFFLMWIAFLPFPTAVMAEYLPEPKGRKVALALYSATFVLIALAYNALWWYAVRGGRLLHEDADREAVRTISSRYLLGPIAYAISFGLAFVNAWASLAVHGFLAVFYILPVRKPTERRPAM